VNPLNDSSTPRRQFLQRLSQAQADCRWQRLVLSRPHAGPRAASPGVLRTTVRPIVLKGQPTLSFVDSLATSDITKNLPVQAGLARVDALLGDVFRNAHLFTTTAELQLKLGKKGRADAGHMTEHSVDATCDAAAPTHDRAKQRWVDQNRPFLTALGVTTADHQLVPAMARKWKQINKFVEIFAHALERSPLKDRTALRVVDFGAGKAYLTFAVHDWLTQAKHLQADVVGVELRPDLVEQGNRVVQDLHLQGMRLAQGDVREADDGAPEPMNVMIALHACDTATDHAIHLGVKAGADIILCSPCCHKQLRPQLLSPHPLRSVFQHGIHAEQQAEMLTDSLRALLLEAQGYDTQVFEFVSLEHTAKNKMILAVKRAAAQPAAPALQQVQELKAFFGVKEHCLETLLQADAAT
jgi:hypothetical protein